MKKILYIFILTALLINVFSVIAYANDSESAVPTADFEIDSELWKVLTEENTFDYDVNKDGIVSIEEFSSSYGMQIDCKDYDIKDWSALSLGTEWQYISIKNFNGTDLSILNQLPKLYEVILVDCPDFNKITGLETLSGLSKLTIESDTEINLGTFANYPALVELDVTAPAFTGYDQLVNIKYLDKLALSGDTCTGIESFPDKYIGETLSISFKDFTDGKMMELATKQPRIKYLSVADCNISGLAWLEKMECLFYLDIRNNMCRDITSLLSYKYLHDMDLYLKGNPWAPDTEDIIAKALLEMEDEYKVSTSDYHLYLEHMHPDWYCDIVGELEFTVSDESMAYIRDSYSQVVFFNPGEFYLLISNGRDVNLKYKFTVTGAPWTPETQKPTATPGPDYSKIILGDVNDDKVISARDALLVLKSAAKLESLGEYALLSADVNVDYDIDAGDALNILKYAAGIISSFDGLAVNTFPPLTPTPTETPTPTKPATYYDNSFVAIAETSEKINFTKEDFAAINAVDLSVAQMLKTDTGYRYELIIYLEDEGCTEEILSSAMETVSAYDNISSVERNGYCKRDSITNLNYDEYELKVGESISIYIDEYKPYFASEYAFCLVFKLKEDKLNGAEINDETLAEYGISSWCKGNDFNPLEFYGSGRNPNIVIREDLTYVVKRGFSIAMVHELSQLPEVESVAILYSTNPTGNRNTEYWHISDESVATMILGGGTPINDNGSITRLYQMATITALAPGEVTVSVEKQGWGAVENEGICKIKIVE